MISIIVSGKNISKLRVFILLAVILLTLVWLVWLFKPEGPDTTGQESKLAKPGYYRVLSVTDGDTIKVDVDGKTEFVRLIGIDAPELPDECFAREAESKAREILQKQLVKLKADKTQDNRDKYGRLLRYVILEDGTNFNRLMIVKGYAQEFTFISAYRLQSEFKKAQKVAKKNKFGLWSPDACRQSG